MYHNLFKYSHRLINLRTCLVGKITEVFKLHFVLVVLISVICFSQLNAQNFRNRPKTPNIKFAIISFLTYNFRLFH